MKFINQEKSSFSIEITPLIDIVFLLVIFFVVTSKVGDSQFLSLDLPKTESSACRYSTCPFGIHQILKYRHIDLSRNLLAPQQIHQTQRAASLPSNKKRRKLDRHRLDKGAVQASSFHKK